MSTGLVRNFESEKNMDVEMFARKEERGRKETWNSPSATPGTKSDGLRLLDRESGFNHKDSKIYCKPVEKVSSGLTQTQSWLRTTTGRRMWVVEVQLYTLVLEVFKCGVSYSIQPDLIDSCDTVSFALLYVIITWVASSLTRYKLRL